MDCGLIADAVQLLSLVDWRQWRLAAQDGEHIRHREIGHRGPRFAGRAAEVRRQHDVFELRQIRMDLRFILEHVERRAGDHVLLQRPRQRTLVDDRAARRVDQESRPLHARERRLIDQPRVSGDSGTCSDTMSDVASSRSSGMYSASGQPGSRRLVTAIFIPNARPRSRDRATDPTATDDAELFALQARPEHELERPALPVARARQTVALAHTARDVENQGPREVGGRIGQHVRRVGADYALLLGVAHVEVVVANCDVGDDLQPWAPRRASRDRFDPAAGRSPRPCPPLAPAAPRATAASRRGACRRRNVPPVGGRQRREGGG